MSTAQRKRERKRLDFVNMVDSFDIKLLYMCYAAQKSGYFGIRCTNSAKRSSFLFLYAKITTHEYAKRNSILAIYIMWQHCPEPLRKNIKEPPNDTILLKKG